MDPLRLSDARREELALETLREANRLGPARERAAERERLDPRLLVPVGLAAAVVLALLWARPAPSPEPTLARVVYADGGDPLRVLGPVPQAPPAPAPSPLSEVYQRVKGARGEVAAMHARLHPSMNPNPLTGALSPLTGRVTSHEGIPLVGARVQLIAIPPPRRAGHSTGTVVFPATQEPAPASVSLRLAISALTTEDGRFVLADAPAGVHALVCVDAPGCAYVPIGEVPPADGPGRRDLEFRVPPGRDFKVQVQDGGGRPVRGVGASLLLSPGRPPSAGPASALRVFRTDARGEAIVRGFPRDGEALLQVEARRFGVASTLRSVDLPRALRGDPDWKVYRVEGWEPLATFVLSPATEPPAPAPRPPAVPSPAPVTPARPR